MASPIVTNTSTQLNGASLVYGFATDLTNAQIKALPVTPVSVVAAPGASLRVKVLGASLHLNATAGAYTNVNTTLAEIVLTYTDAATGIWCAHGPSNDASVAVPLANLTAAFGAASIIIDFVTPSILPTGAGAQSGSLNGWIQGTQDAAASGQVNLPVYLSINNNGSGALTGGNASNSGRLFVYYALEDVS